MSVLHSRPHCLGLAHITSRLKYLKASQEGTLSLHSPHSCLSWPVSAGITLCFSFPSEASHGFLLPAELP